MKSIEVTMPMDKWDAVGSETACGIRLLELLRQAGIPAVGRIMLQGVEHGTLEITKEQCFNEMIYTWTPDPDYDPASGL